MTTLIESRSLRLDRVLGATAIALAASLVAQIVVLPGAPTYSASMDEVLEFHAEHRSLIGVATGLEALNLPLLLGFLVGLGVLAQRRGGAGADWARLAAAAGAAFSAIIAIYAVLWNGTVFASADLAEPSPVLELVWKLHASAFALAFPALGVTFVGAALAARAFGATPPWQAWLGLVGGGLLVVAGGANLAIADGSALLFVGMPGYVAWIVWLLCTGVRLVRGQAPGSGSVAPRSHKS